MMATRSFECVLSDLKGSGGSKILDECKEGEPEGQGPEGQCPGGLVPS